MILRAPEGMKTYWHAAVVILLESSSWYLEACYGSDTCAYVIISDNCLHQQPWIGSPCPNLTGEYFHLFLLFPQPKLRISRGSRHSPNPVACVLLPQIPTPDICNVLSYFPTCFQSLCRAGGRIKSEHAECSGTFHCSDHKKSRVQTGRVI